MPRADAARPFGNAAHPVPFISPAVFWTMLGGLAAAGVTLVGVLAALILRAPAVL